MTPLTRLLERYLSHRLVTLSLLVIYVLALFAIALLVGYQTPDTPYMDIEGPTK